jgi:hypothetical protein
MGELARRIEGERSPSRPDSQEDASNARSDDSGSQQRQGAVEQSDETPQSSAQVQAAAPQADDDPSAPSPELTREAFALAQRQQRLAGQIEALEKGNPTKSLAGAQEQLSEQVRELAAAVDLIREHSADLMPDPALWATAARAAEYAGEASTQALQASRQTERAAQSPGDPDPLGQAQALQTQTATALREAARTMSELGQAMQNAAGGIPEQPEPPLDPEAMADAMEAAAEASQQPSQAERAAEYLEALAKGAVGRARMMGLMQAPTPAQMAAAAQGAMMSSGMQPGDGSVSDHMEEEPVTLEQLGLTADDWARLPGELRDDILTAAEQSGAPEYREIIRDYFEELARRSGRRREEQE